MTANYSPRLQALISDALIDIQATLATVTNPVVAFSGGKDANVAMHLIQQVRETTAVCETSFMFEPMRSDIEQSVARLGYKVAFKNSLDWKWLSNHQEFIFSNDNKARSKSFKLRHQTTVKNHAANNGNDMLIFGRRTEENNVKSKLYFANNILNYFPIREWKERDIWEYIDKTPELSVPWIYSTFFGECEGSAPFYTIRAKYFAGGSDEAWDYCKGLDTNITRERLNVS